jgi:hypothetical protein
MKTLSLVAALWVSSSAFLSHFGMASDLNEGTYAIDGLKHFSWKRVEPIEAADRLADTWTLFSANGKKLIRGAFHTGNVQSTYEMMTAGTDSYSDAGTEMGPFECFSMIKDDGEVAPNRLCQKTSSSFYIFKRVEGRPSKDPAGKIHYPEERFHYELAKIVERATIQSGMYVLTHETAYDLSRSIGRFSDRNYGPGFWRVQVGKNSNGKMAFDIIYWILGSGGWMERHQLEQYNGVTGSLYHPKHFLYGKKMPGSDRRRVIGNLLLDGNRIESAKNCGYPIRKSQETRYPHEGQEIDYSACFRFENSTSPIPGAGEDSVVENCFCRLVQDSA